MTRPAESRVLRQVGLRAEAVRVGRPPPPGAVALASTPGGASSRSAAVTPAASFPAACAPAPAACARAPDAAAAPAPSSGGADPAVAGYEEGLRRGEAAARAEMEPALAQAVAAATAALHEREAQLAQTLQSLERQRQAFWEAAEDEAVALCFELLCRVVGDALVSASGLRAQVGLLLAQAPSEFAALHLHPADLASVQDLAESSGLRCVPDPEVALGGCLLRGPAGTLDARLETLLARCRDSLLETRARHVVSLPAAAPQQEQKQEAA